MKQLLFLFSTVFITFSSNAQVNISYYPWNNLFGISTNTNKLIWIDLKAEVNTFFGNLNTEQSLHLNIKKTEFVNYYLGIGISTNYIRSTHDGKIVNGYYANFGARIKPMNNTPNLQIIAELSPYFNSEFQSGILRFNLGLGYEFIRTKRN